MRKEPLIHKVFKSWTSEKAAAKVDVLRGTTTSVQYLKIIHNALASVPVWCQSPNTIFPQSFSNELTSKNHSSKDYKTA